MKHFRVKTLFCLTALLFCSCGKNNGGNNEPPKEEPVVLGEHNIYTNPINPIVNGEKKPTYIADPYVVKDGEDYYLYCTQTDCYIPNLTFVRGPIFHSTNMVDWYYQGNVFSSYNPNWGTSGAGVWAPTVVKIGDHWNYYYSLSVGEDTNPGIGVATSPTPYGPWDHKGKLFKSEEIGVINSIDPHVLVDNDKVYMVFGSFGGLITIIELESDGLSLKNGIEYQKENKVALGGYQIFELDNYEASFIFKKDNYYYLLLSTGSCLSGINSTYHVVCARSENITGPYLDSKGRDIFHPKRGDAVVVPTRSTAMGVGHCCVVQDDANNYWMYYHGYSVGSSYETWRVLYVDLLSWDKETGMPRVNGDSLASNNTPMPGPYIRSIEEAYE